MGIFRILNCTCTPSFWHFLQFMANHIEKNSVISHTQTHPIGSLDDPITSAFTEELKIFLNPLKLNSSNCYIMPSRSNLDGIM